MIIKYDKTDALREKNDFGMNKIDEIKIVVIQSTDVSKASLAYANLNKTKQPAHYVIDGDSIIKYAPSSTCLYGPEVAFTSKAKDLLNIDTVRSTEAAPDILSSIPSLKDILDIKKSENQSSVITALDYKLPGNNILIIEVCNNEDIYKKTSKMLTSFLGYLIKNHGLTTDNIWRSGDIVSGDKNPYQYYHISHFNQLLENARAFAKNNCEGNPQDSPYCFELDDHEDSADHCPFPGEDPEHSHSGHIHHWEPDERSPKLLKTVQAKEGTMKDEDFTTLVINGSVFVQSNFQSNIDQNTVKMESNFYEPIYPDLTVPPRGATSLYNLGVESTKQILTRLTDKERLEKEKIAEAEAAMREDNGNIISTEPIPYSSKSKPVIGKVPNIFDAYPIDDKIAQLEHHAPLVTLEFEEAEKVNSNMSFYFLNRSINIEKRLVQLENIMSTQVRNLNRLSSRIVINCVYYGGQSVFDKYKCIRCLSDDLVNDAAQVTLDQCLNCSRYEPIEGQVYEIMDETLKPGEANLYDDIQASYMTKDDYIALTRIEEQSEEPEAPSQDITKTSVRDDEDKDYTDLLGNANNFVMNWERKPLDKQSPHINEYVYDFASIGLDKDRLDPANKYEDGWRAVKQNKYQRPDYGTNTLGDGSNSGASTGSFNSGPVYFSIDDYDIDKDDLRFKILKYASEACELGEKHQSFLYTFGAKIKNRLLTPAQLVEKAVKGEEVSTGKNEKDTENAVYTDCSNFTNYIYYCASGGKYDIPGTTSSLSESSEFKVLGKGKQVLEAIKEAIPGDLILYRNIDGGHVVIYAGNDECYEAAYEDTDKSKQVCKSKLKNKSDFFGILRYSKLSEPKLKNIRFLDVNMTAAEYTKKYQCSSRKNTIDGNDNGYTTDLSVLLPWIDPVQQFSDDASKCQFITLKNTFPDGYITESGLAKFFAKKKRLSSMPAPSAFIEAGRVSGINPLIIASICAMETGWGTSNWMNGSGVYKDSSGRIVYNAFGLWCYNSDPKRTKAVQQCSDRGWFTREKAVIEGAAYFMDAYTSESSEKAHGIRNTPYFMKWHFGNTIAGNNGSPGTMQYASAMKWANNAGRTLYEMMECMPGGAAEGMKHLQFIVPRFKAGDSK